MSPDSYVEDASFGAYHCQGSDGGEMGRRVILKRLNWRSEVPVTANLEMTSNLVICSCDGTSRAVRACLSNSLDLQGRGQGAVATSADQTQLEASVRCAKQGLAYISKWHGLSREIQHIGKQDE